MRDEPSLVGHFNMENDEPIVPRPGLIAIESGQSITCGVAENSDAENPHTKAGEPRRNAACFARTMASSSREVFVL